MTEPSSSAAPIASSSLLDEETDERDDAAQPRQVVCATFDTVVEAELARGRLEVEGIAARLVDNNTVAVAAHLSRVLGGVKLVVASENLEAARAILFAPSALADVLEDVPVTNPETPAGLSTTDEAEASRALRAAVLGLLVPVLPNLYALYLSARLVRRLDNPLVRRRVAIAVGVSTLALAGYAALLAAL